MGLEAKGLGFPPRPGQAQGLFKKVAAHMPRQPGQEVVDHAHLLEQRIVLEGPANTATGRVQGIDATKALLLEDDLAAVEAVDPIQQVEQRTLARAVGPDQGADLTAPHFE